MMTTIRERVAAGAALLDEKRPDWFMEIDCATLNIASGYHCICGQLYGSYERGVQVLGVHPPSYAFLQHMMSLDALNEAWREAIAARRLARERVLQPA